MYSTTTNTTTTTTTTSTTPTNTTQLSPAQRTPSLSPYAPHPQPDNHAHIKDAIHGLIDSIADLPNRNEPNFSTLLSICGTFKNNAVNLEQAQCQPSLASELNLLRQQLPQLFKQIDRSLDIQIRSNTSLELDPLETFCMGLSTLAPPLTGSLLTDAQRERALDTLTAISAKLAKLLAGHFRHSIVDAGALLNCANWFSRALKANLIKKDQPDIHVLFDDTLHQMHTWSDTRTKPSNLNSRQFSKCMVQLNTMIKQRLIPIHPNRALGQANRTTWAATVQNLCNHFLSESAWLYECNLIELINITNTLKDGLEQGLLSSSDQSLAPVFNLLAQRIRDQEFDLSNASSLTGLANCANFLRSLFEHNLLDSAESETGQAVLHLVHAHSSNKITSELNDGSAQALVNLASFIKATDRWLSTQPKLAKVGSHALLAQASATLMDALSVLADNQHSSWVRSPQTCSALLAALQHLWQRGLVEAKQHDLLEPILRQLLQSIPNWRQAERNSQSTLLSLRAIVAMTGKGSPVDLRNTSVFAESLTPLLVQLQQSKQTNYTAEERLYSLRAVQIGVALGAVSLAALQPLLQSLLETKDKVDLPQLEEAIYNLNRSEKLLEALSAEALKPAAALTNAASLEANQAKQSKPRGETYRGPAAQPTKQDRIIDAPPAFSGLIWKTVDKGIKSPLLQEEPPLPLPFIATPSSAPKVVERSPEQKTTGQSEGNKQKEKTTEIKKTALMTSLQSVLAEKAKTTQIKPTTEARTLKEAQARWFNLLQELKSTSLEELKKLAEVYPQLLNMKAPGKQGQVALFYALTQAKKEIVEWLMKQEQHSMAEPLGEFLKVVLKGIETIERRHVSVVRVLIETYLKQYEQQIQAAHVQDKPGAKPLSKQAIIDMKNRLLTVEEKAELILFPALTALFEETKLIKESERNINAFMKIKIEGEKKEKKVISLIQLVNRLAEAIESGDLTALKIALKNNEFLRNYSSKDAMFDVINAAWVKLMTTPHMGQAAMFKALLDKVKDKDKLAQVRNVAGMTALIIAANQGHTETVKAIFGAVSDKDSLSQIKCNDGWTALSAAAIAGHVEIVMSILNAVDNKDALANQSKKDGWTALMIAADKGHSDIVKSILNAVDNKDRLANLSAEDGWTVLMTAAEKGHSDIVNTILNAVDNKDRLANLLDEDGWTALMVAAAEGHSDIVNTILNAVDNKEALANIKGKDGMTAMNLATAHGHINAATVIRNGLDNKKALARLENNDVATTLNPATITDQTKMAPVLMKKVNDNGTTQIKNKDE
jgi:ankyrin repeat protein